MRVDGAGGAAELTGLQIEAELGRGAFTTVHRASRGDQRYALKLSHEDAAGDPAVQVAVNREAALLACVDDPAVVRVHAAGRIDGTPALVTEFIPGGSLADLLAHGRLDQEQTVRLAAQLARGLAAAHRVGLVHRDLKPHNIMVPPDGPAKLIDFGLALLGTGTGGDGEPAVGTLLYAAPEQSGALKRPVDPRSDLYSLGVVLFECLIGSPPFEAGDVGELVRLHLTALPDLAARRPDIDPALAAVVTRLLAKDPDDRYPDAAALLDDLRACPGGSDVTATAGSTWPLCGREAQLGRLLDRWQRARAGAGGTAVIRGGAGSGRGRLAAEVAERIAAQGVPVLRATGTEDGTLPRVALREAVDGYLADVARLPATRRAEAGARLREAATVAGAALVARLSARAEAVLGVPPATDARDDHVLAAGAAFLAELARLSGGLLLLLDDAQWLDGASRQVLARLGTDLPGLPLLVLLTELDGAGVPVDGAGDVEVGCGPLVPEEVEALVASRLPGARVTPELTAHVATRTDGTPLSVVTYLLRLVDAGLLTPLWGTWHLDAAGAAALPAAADVRELLATRLAALPHEVREVLRIAAVAGDPFRLELLAAVDPVAAGSGEAIATAVDRRVVEPRAGGSYGFIHPALREALLAGTPEHHRRSLHAAVAVALESLPAPLHAAGHVYAVAAHYRQAGDAAPGDAVRRSARAAGLRALADQDPGAAVEYLRAAAGPDGTGVPRDLWHPLATAYLRTGRFPEAERLLTGAIEAEPDARDRARLRITLAELQHTVWADDQAVASVHAALADLGRPLPRHPLPALVSTLAIAVLGGLVRRTRLGYGTVRGTRRQDLATLAAVFDVGAYSAAIGLRLREAALFAFRALYAVNRIGPCPEYVRVYSQIGYVTGVMRLRGTAERCFARAAATAAGLGDPSLGAYVEWVRGCVLLFGGYDDGHTWDQAIARHARWYVPAQLLVGYATRGLRLVLRGYTEEGAAEYERGMRHLLDPTHAHGMSLGMLGVIVPAQQGRPAAAAAMLAGMRETFAGGAGTPVQRAHVLTAAMCACIEQGEFGAPFDATVAEFHALGLRTRDLMPQHKWFFMYQAHGRMAQLRLASDAERPQRLAAAREAIRQLGRAKGSPLLRAAHGMARAALRQQCGDSQRAIAIADRTQQRARPLDAPVVSFEASRVRARAFRQLGMVAEAERQARTALSLATRYGWESRRRQVRAEFGLEEGSSALRRTAVDRGVDGGRNRRLEALQQVATAAATVLDPHELARVALDESLRILGAERALFFLYDEAGEPSQFAGRDAHGDDLGEATAYGATLVRRVAETGEALVLTGTDQGAALGSRSAVAYGLRSILVAPVRFKGRPIGVVYLDSRMARGIFTDDDLDVLTAITGHVAASLETARAAQLHVAVRTARQEQALAEMLRTSLAELSAILDPTELLRRLFTTLHERLGADTGRLLCADGDGYRVVGVAGTGDPADVGSPLPEALAARLADAGEAVLIEDAGTGSPPHVTLAVPLDGRDGRAAVVLLGGARLDDTARQVAAALATQGMSAYDNARLFSRVQQLATTDELTGQPNRRHFYALAGALVPAAARSGRTLAAAMVDIDNFKRINDTYGHGVGDEVIRAVAARVRAGIRHSDVLGRYGGEEFAVVLPDEEGQAADLAERMRGAVADTPVPTRSGPVAVTISVGLTRLAPGDGLDDLLARADHALYRAKEDGRNRVAVM